MLFAQWSPKKEAEIIDSLTSIDSKPTLFQAMLSLLRGIDNFMRLPLKYINFEDEHEFEQRVEQHKEKAKRLCELYIDAQAEVCKQIKKKEVAMQR